MANQQFLNILNQGVEAWNQWRKDDPGIEPDLHNANLEGRDLAGADLSGSDLSGANFRDKDFRNPTPGRFRGTSFRGSVLSGAQFYRTDLQEADLRGTILQGADLTGARLTGQKLGRVDFSSAKLMYADLSYADLTGSDLTGADLSGATAIDARLNGSYLARSTLLDANFSLAHLEGAYLTGADLRGTDLSNAHLASANLERATMERTDLRGTDLTGCFVYGVSAWGVKLNGEITQTNLRITPEGEPIVTVDDLEAAQFVYLLQKGERIRSVINTASQKAVLILGRFTEGKAILDSIKDQLSQRNYLPIVFDFERPTNRDFTETVVTLAGMSRFIIAEITKPKSVPLELQATIPNFMIPFVPIIQEGEEPFSMFQDLSHKYNDWVIDPVAYSSVEELVSAFDGAVIDPANERLRMLRSRKDTPLNIRHAKEYEKGRRSI